MNESKNLNQKCVKKFVNLQFFFRFNVTFLRIIPLKNNFKKKHQQCLLLMKKLYISMINKKIKIKIKKFNKF